ncbi:aromatic-ring-hydroxylating dioxygenase subunit beta [Bacillus tuaregi]|uniref:aromatic-ring-hydroxylating dioxygenase subunit beta n=1 Tax=Bacillus tuaregi TaxID=1816695 RepID=UPI0008F8528E|nr:3-phenylpropionate/cinnamic acid dioxygenase subunit beta [Bacillus tuaregi]
MVEIKEQNQYIVNLELQNEITLFYYREAELLDTRDYHSWFQLLSEDIIYRMPSRVTRDSSSGSDIIDEMSYFEDDYTTMKTRVDRLYTKSAWSHDPPSRTRHFISHVRMKKGEKENELEVKSYFQYIRNRGNQTINDQLTGERVDILQRVGEDWKIAKRTIYPDHAVIGTLNLHNFF